MADHENLQCQLDESFRTLCNERMGRTMEQLSDHEKRLRFLERLASTLGGAVTIIVLIYEMWVKK